MTTDERLSVARKARQLRFVYRSAGSVEGWRFFKLIPELDACAQGDGDAPHFCGTTHSLTLTVNEWGRLGCPERLVVTVGPDTKGN